MGLDVSHDAWSGAYSAFNRFRQKIAAAIGGSFPPHADPKEFPDPTSWYTPQSMTALTHPGLFEFLSHSDCDGEIGPEMCAHVADELEALIPKIAELDDGDRNGGFSMARTEDGIKVASHPGHIARVGGYVAATQRFISGCRAAHAAGEPLEFF